VQQGTHGISVSWASSAPDGLSLLSSASHSALVIGTSLFRIVHSDLFVYRDWLKEGPERLLGLIFLNPHSPHARGRERQDVHRSSFESISDSLKIALQQAGQNSQIIPAIYDGPFRYSARAVDIGEGYESDSSSIELVTSSHLKGISRGFSITLPGARSSRPYEYYRRELLDVWRGALSNRPGHGISIIGSFDGHSLLDSLAESTHVLLAKAKGRNPSLHTFSNEQLHVTISALCRTQESILLGPLRLGRSPASLPPSFGTFLCEVVGSYMSIVNDDLVFEFTRVGIDPRGFVSLMGVNSSHEAAVHKIDVLLDRVRELATSYSRRYPRDGWGDTVRDGHEPRFGPKYPAFMPSMTLGMGFASQQSLPLPILGLSFAHDLPRPMSLRVTAPRIVHYAYRSLLRTVGEFAIGKSSSAQQEAAVLQALGIQFEGPASHSPTP
jgi:hypothetical protein